jgi:voltage-gated potassium channel
MNFNKGLVLIFMKTIKDKMFHLLVFDDGDPTLSEKLFSAFMLVLIVLNTFMVIIETFKGLSSGFRSFMRIFEIVSIITFSIEYVLRVWTADYLYSQIPARKARLKYIFSALAIIDLLAIIPFYIPFLIPLDLRALRAVRIIRLLRLFKVSRFTKSIELIGRVIKEKAGALLSSIFIMLILLTIAATLMFSIESIAQPDKFDTVFSGFWWAVATLTTVGYGDIYPITAVGKILSSIISVAGIGIIALPTSILSAGFIEELNKNKKSATGHFCPHCGKQIDT